MLLDDAIAIMDRHASAIQQLAQGGAKVQESELAKMLAIEEDIFNRMTPSEREVARNYAERVRSKIASEAEKVNGLLGVRKASPGTKAAAGQQGDKRCYCIPVLLICHRRCCNPDRGNGVAIGLWDCNAGVISDGC